MKVRYRGEEYDALDQECPRRPCWSPGPYAHHGAVGAAGYRFTGRVTMECLIRAHHGCPVPIPEPARKRNRRLDRPEVRDGPPAADEEAEVK